jgi:hypothetical protein
VASNSWAGRVNPLAVQSVTWLWRCAGSRLVLPGSRSWCGPAEHSHRSWVDGLGVTRNPKINLSGGIFRVGEVARNSLVGLSTLVVADGHPAPHLGPRPRVTRDPKINLSGWIFRAGARNIHPAKLIKR